MFLRVLWLEVSKSERACLGDPARAMAELSEQDMYFGVCMELMQETNGKWPTAKRLAEAAELDVDEAKEILEELKSSQPKKKPKAAAAKPKAKAAAKALPQPPANEAEVEAPPSEVPAPPVPAPTEVVEIVEIPDNATQVYSPDNQLGLLGDSLQVEAMGDTQVDPPEQLLQLEGKGEPVLTSPAAVGRGDSQRPDSCCVCILVHAPFLLAGPLRPFFAGKL